MFNSYDNQSIRKLVVAFGSLFDEIYVTRKNDTTGAIENVKVPITFSSKEKFLRRLESNSSISDNVKTQINVPYLSFEIAAISYDFGRKRNKLTKTSKTVIESGIPSSNYITFSETPIKVLFNLYFYSRSLNEIFQVVEQVMPYFNPEFNIRINFNKIFQNVNVPISYRDFKLIDDYEGSLQARRTAIGVMSFTASSFIFGEIKEKDVIQTVTGRSLLDSGLDVNVNIDITNIVINTLLDTVIYSLPSQQSTLLSNMTWTEYNTMDLETRISIFTFDTNILLHTLVIPAGTNTLTNAQLNQMITNICTELDICTDVETSERILVFRVENGLVQAQRNFRVIMNCTTACQ